MQANLLSLYFTRIAGDEPGFSQNASIAIDVGCTTRRSFLTLFFFGRFYFFSGGINTFIKLNERTGDTMSNGACLAHNATAFDGNHYIEFIGHFH